MPDFVCSSCQAIESTSLADYYIQVKQNKQKALCCKCKTGKHHNKFPQRKATVHEILRGEIIHFEEFKDVNLVKKKMIDFITNDGKSILPRDKFEKMTLYEILIIYRHMKGKQK